jgi:hypothetical protein
MMWNRIVGAFVEGFTGGIARTAKEEEYKKEVGRFFDDFLEFLETIHTPEQTRLVRRWGQKSSERYDL